MKVKNLIVYVNGIRWSFNLTKEDWGKHKLVMKLDSDIGAGGKQFEFFGINDKSLIAEFFRNLFSGSKIKTGYER